MSELYERMIAAVTDRTAVVHLDVDPPRAAPNKQLVAYLFEPVSGEVLRPQGVGIRLTITHEQARTLLRAGAHWAGPAHLRAEVLPDA
jgi:hypothetical protein